MYYWDPQNTPHRSICGEWCVSFTCSPVYIYMSCMLCLILSPSLSLPQGCWMYILWNGCRSAAVPRIHRWRWAASNLQITGWVNTHPRTHSRPALQLNDSIQSLCDETHTSTPDITTFKHTHSHQMCHGVQSQKCFSPALKTNCNHLSCHACCPHTHTHTQTHTRFCMETVRSHGRLPQFSWNPVLLTLTWCVLTVRPGVWNYLGKKTWKGGLSYIQIVFFLTVAQYCMVLTMPRSWVWFPGKAWTD